MQIPDKPGQDLFQAGYPVIRAAAAGKLMVLPTEQAQAGRASGSFQAAEHFPCYDYIEYAYARPHRSDYINFFWNPGCGNAADHMVNTVEWTGGEIR